MTIIVSKTPKIFPRRPLGMVTLSMQIKITQKTNAAMPLRHFFTILLAAAPFIAPQAQDWVNFASISPTTTLENNHLCYSDGRDIACSDRDFTVLANGNVGIGTSTPTTALHVSGTLRISDGGETASAAGAGAIRYTAGTLEYSNGTVWTALGGGGATTLASLTDVSLTTPASGSILRYDGTNWIDIADLSTAISTTTITPDWPDAVTCSTANIENLILPRVFRNSSRNLHFYRYITSSSTNQIVFNNDGSFNGAATNMPSTYDCVSESKSIATLYADGQAFNFLGNNGANTTLNELADVSTTGVTTGQTLAYNGTSWVVSNTAVTDDGDWTISGGDIYRATGNVGIGTSAPTAALHVSGTTDASLSDSSGLLVLGDIDGLNLVLDGNEIVSRDDGAISSLLLAVDSSSTLRVGGGVVGGKLNVDVDATEGNIPAILTQNTALDYAVMSSETVQIGHYNVDTLTAMPSIIILPSGNTGIGALAPTTALHVSGTLRIADGGETASAAGAGAIRYTAGTLEYSNGTTWAALVASGSGGGLSTLSDTDGDTSITLENSGDTDTISFTTAGVERMMIDEAGRVGIGTDNPAATLNVVSESGDALTISQGGGARQWIFGSGLRTNTTLSVGAINPPTATELFVQGLAFRPTAIFRAATAQTADLLQLRSFSATNGDLMTVTGDGNVGIGTNNPTAKLNVNGPSTSENTFIDVAATPGETGNSVRLRLGWSPSGITDNILPAQMVVDANGNLHMSSRSNAPSGILFYTNAATDALERMRITNTGNVGIGTTNPTEKLHVVGSAGKTVGGTTWVNLSDRRLKNIDSAYNRGLTDIVQLQPVMFHYKEDNDLDLSADAQEYGFIAQDVQKIFPEAVTESKNGYLSFNMHPINVSLVNAIKELKLENDTLKAQLTTFEERLKALEKP